jgi:hypothetical protein
MLAMSVMWVLRMITGVSRRMARLWSYVVSCRCLIRVLLRARVVVVPKGLRHLNDDVPMLCRYSRYCIDRDGIEVRSSVRYISVGKVQARDSRIVDR